MSLVLAVLSLIAQDAAPAVDPLAPLPEVEPVETPEPDIERAPSPQVARARLCPTRSFRGEIVFDEDPPRRSAVILCADSNEPADYEAMLRSAKREVAFNGLFTIESRSALMARIDEALAALAEETSPSAEEAAPVGR